MTSENQSLQARGDCFEEVESVGMLDIIIVMT